MNRIRLHHSVEHVSHLIFKVDDCIHCVRIRTRVYHSITHSYSEPRSIMIRVNIVSGIDAKITQLPNASK